MLRLEFKIDKRDVWMSRTSHSVREASPRLSYDRMQAQARAPTSTNNSARLGAAMI